MSLGLGGVAAAVGVWLVTAEASSAGAFGRSGLHALSWDGGEWKALGLSTFAGLATSLGGILAVIKRPDQALLALLLGIAIGVMATLSLVELFLRNAMENGFVGVSVSTALGAAFYVMLEPFIPHVDLPATRAGDGTDEGGAGDCAPATPTGKGGRADSRAKLMRLGFLMAVTMTLHNLPEGFAVAFSSYTDVGLLMATAVAVHNVPEGIIVAAPVYAATNNRRYAIWMATASGLSEPLGAVIALTFIRPFLTELRLQYMLAFVGGIMTAVCFVELLPEGRRCRHDGRLAQGTALGAVVMGATLWIGV